MQYRLYFLDGTGRIAGEPYEFEAPSDELAVRIAEASLEGRSGELWSKARKLQDWK